jgi:hypothetical protein
MRKVQSLGVEAVLKLLLELEQTIGKDSFDVKAENGQ